MRSCGPVVLRWPTASVTQLYAYFYKPNPPLPTNEGWTICTPREEFARMGVGSRTKAWRFTDINKDYNVRLVLRAPSRLTYMQFCPTYPAKLVIPAKISDATLQYAVKYRSKARIPVLAYLHWANLVGPASTSSDFLRICRAHSRARASRWLD